MTARTALSEKEIQKETCGIVPFCMHAIQNNLELCTQSKIDCQLKPVRPGQVTLCAGTPFNYVA